MLSDDQGWNGLSVAMQPKLRWFERGNLSHAKLGTTRNARHAFLERILARTCLFLPRESSTKPERVLLNFIGRKRPTVEGHGGIEPKLVKNISKDEATVAELLKRAGYATAHYGKWHIMVADQANMDTTNMMVTRQ